MCTRVPAEAVDEEARENLVDRRKPLPDGSRLARLVAPGTSGGAVDLAPGFLSAGRADISHDGRRLLFVGRREANEPFRAWEVGTDGSNPRIVAACPTDCLAAIYLSTIYTLDADAPVPQIGLVSRPAAGLPPALYTVGLDGSRLRRITFNLFGSFDPVLISDGRLVFATGLAGTSGEAALRVRETGLMTVFPDGVGLFPFAAMHDAPAFRFGLRPLGRDRVAFIESGTDGDKIITVPRARSLVKRTELATEVGTSVASLWPMKDQRLLLSARARDAATFDLFLAEADTSGQWAPVIVTEGWHELDPVVVEPRPMPAGRSSVVRDELDEGELYGLDVYLADGSVSPMVERGRIHSVRVYAVPSDFAEEVALGTLPVEFDGSFYGRVPAMTPLRLETLDGEGRSITAMHNWFWIMPGEHRGCIGCHEDRELTPPNRHVLALRKPPHVLRLPAEHREGGDTTGLAAEEDRP